MMLSRLLGELSPVVSLRVTVPTCQVRCANWCDICMPVWVVTRRFLNGFAVCHRMEFVLKSCKLGQKFMAGKVIGPNRETTVVLLSGHDVPVKSPSEHYVYVPRQCSCQPPSGGSKCC